MFKKLYPCLYVNSLQEIPLKELKALEKRALILDLDNTVTEWNSNYIATEIAAWFANLQAQGFKACLLSNNTESRVAAVADSLGIPYVCRAQKPRRGAFYRALALLEVEAAETVVVGDQVFTDVLGGNRAGLYTILVSPLASREFMGTKMTRSLEFFVLRRIKKKVAWKAD